MRNTDKVGIITIAHTTIAMPADLLADVVHALSESAIVNRHYDTGFGYKYTIDSEADIEIQIVDSSKVVTKERYDASKNAEDS